MLHFYCLKSDQYSVTNILYVDRFLLSKLFLKQCSLIIATREYNKSQQQYRDPRKSGD